MTLARLAATTALAAALPSLPAHAACMFTGPTTLECVDTTTAPVDENIDNLDLTNTGSIDISVDEDAVKLEGLANTVTNSGTINAMVGGNEAIQATSSRPTRACRQRNAAPPS
jgi:hypothetical protein